MLRKTWKQETGMRKGGFEISVGAWIMLIIYAVGLGGGSIALIAYSLRKNDI